MLYFLSLLAEVLLLYILMRKLSRKLYNFLGPYPFAILFLPGTFVHEMSHFLTALFLFVPVGQIDLMPAVEKEGLKMGSVPVGKTDLIRRTFIGIAPIVFGLAIILGSVFYVYTNNLFTSPLAVIILAYISFEIGNTMFSSKKDLEGSLVFAILGVIVFLILYFLGLRLTFDVNPEIFQKALFFLLVPLGLDTLLLVLLGFRN